MCGTFSSKHPSTFKFPKKGGGGEKKKMGGNFIKSVNHFSLSLALPQLKRREILSLLLVIIAFCLSSTREALKTLKRQISQKKTPALHFFSPIGEWKSCNLFPQETNPIQVSGCYREREEEGKGGFFLPRTPVYTSCIRAKSFSENRSSVSPFFAKALAFFTHGGENNSFSLSLSRWNEKGLARRSSVWLDYNAQYVHVKEGGATEKKLTFLRRKN